MKHFWRAVTLFSSGSALGQAIGGSRRSAHTIIGASFRSDQAILRSAFPASSSSLCLAFTVSSHSGMGASTAVLFVCPAGTAIHFGCSAIRFKRWSYRSPHCLPPRLSPLCDFYSALRLALEPSSFYAHGTSVYLLEHSSLMLFIAPASLSSNPTMERTPKVFASRLAGSFG